MTATLASRIAEALPLARLVANPAQEIAGRVLAIRAASASNTKDEASRLRALADEVEAVFREMEPNLEAMVTMLRWAAPATVCGGTRQAAV